MTQPIRGTDVWLKDDIRAALEGLLLTNELMATHATPTSDYRRGFAAAIIAAAVTFGVQLDWTARPEVRRLLNWQP